MTCVFSVFYFMYLFFSDAKSFKEKMPFFLRYVIYSLIGGFLGSICWLTAFLHFSGTKATLSLPKFDFGSLSMLLTGFLENNYMTTGNITQNFGYASMFTGMVSLVFFLRSFFNPGIKVRERISYGVLFFFYCLCILSTTLNALMHGGREPTWFPARFSYILGFLVCYFAFKECEHRETSSNISSLVALLVPAVVLPIVVFTKNSNRFEPDSINAPYLYYSISWPSFIVYYLTAILSSLYPFLKRYSFGKKYEKWILLEIFINAIVFFFPLCFKICYMTITLLFSLLFLAFCLFRATPAAYGGSQARGLIGAVASGLHQSHSNAGSVLRLRPTPQLTATLDP